MTIVAYYVDFFMWNTEKKHKIGQKNLKTVLKKRYGLDHPKSITTCIFYWYHCLEFPLEIKETKHKLNSLRGHLNNISWKWVFSKYLFKIIFV